MSVDSFKARWPENVPGTFYVSDQCVDCDACRKIAPQLFQRSHQGQYSYVVRQPTTPPEARLALQAVEACCTSAIHTDGDRFDWELTHARTQPHALQPEAAKPGSPPKFWPFGKKG